MTTTQVEMLEKQLDYYLESILKIKTDVRSTVYMYLVIALGIGASKQYFSLDRQGFIEIVITMFIWFLVISFTIGMVVLNYTSLIDLSSPITPEKIKSIYSSDNSEPKRIVEYYGAITELRKRLRKISIGYNIGLGLVISSAISIAFIVLLSVIS